MLWHRNGSLEFAKNRVKRILLPLLIGMLTVVPACIKIGIAGFSADPTRQVPLMLLSPWQLLHLWFLWYLLIYYVLAIPLFIAERMSWKETFVQSVGFVWNSPYRAFILAVPTAIISWQHRAPGFESPGNWIPNFQLLTYYGLFFFCGWLLQGQPHLLYRKSRLYRLELGIASLTLLASLALTVQDLAIPVQGSVIHLLAV